MLYGAILCQAMLCTCKPDTYSSSRSDHYSINFGSILESIEALLLFHKNIKGKTILLSHYMKHYYTLGPTYNKYCDLIG